MQGLTLRDFIRFIISWTKRALFSGSFTVADMAVDKQPKVYKNLTADCQIIFFSSFFLTGIGLEQACAECDLNSDSASNADTPDTTLARLPSDSPKLPSHAMPLGQISPPFSASSCPRDRRSQHFRPIDALGPECRCKLVQPRVRRTSIWNTG